MCDKMAISAHILKIVESDPFLRLQMAAKGMFYRHQFFFIPYSSSFVAGDLQCCSFEINTISMALFVCNFKAGVQA